MLNIAGDTQIKKLCVKHTYTRYFSCKFNTKQFNIKCTYYNQTFFYNPLTIKKTIY